MKVFMILAMCFANFAFAELDPELAEVSSSNFNREGLFLGAQVSGWTAFDTATSRGGAAFNYGGEVGYVMPRGSWDRLEISAFVGRGVRQFTEKGGTKAKQTMEDKFAGIVRVGIGYSLGTTAMAVWRIGAGLFSSDYTTEISDTKYTSTSSYTGPVGQIGADLVLQATPALDFIVGLNVNQYQFDVDKVSSAQTDLEIDKPLNVNEIAAVLSMRYQL